MHESLYMYPIVESVHVLTLCLFVGMAVLLDLRLLGLTLPRVPVQDLTDRLMPFMVTGFVIMFVTGLLLFYAIPVRSYLNIFFRLKVIALVLAGANALYFHEGVHKRVHQWGADQRTPARARFAGAASLFLWAFIIVCGRMIAYNWFDCDMHLGPVMQTLTGCPTTERR